MLRLLVLLAAVPACGTSGPAAAPDELTAEQREQLATLSPLGPVPPDPSNAFADDARAAELGQMLFFDDDLAGEPGTLSCATCHDGPALDDQPHHVSTGAGIGSRNSPPLINASFHRWSNWGGRFDSQWALVAGAIENPEVMNGARVAVARTLAAKYRAEYDALFEPGLDPALDPGPAGDARFPAAARPKRGDSADGAWERMAEADRQLVDRVFAGAGKAVAAYLRTLVARNAPFDRYVAGDRQAISPAARRGLALFLEHCQTCHRGPHMQDDAFHAIGVAQFGEHVPDADLGRFTDVAPLLTSPFSTAGPHSDGPSRLAGLAQSPELRGQFRTPSLRNVAVTAPYMHAGQLPTLEAVIAFYNVGGGNVPGITKSAEMRRLGLTAEQQSDLVEFLRTLTDTAVPPERLVDTSR